MSTSQREPGRETIHHSPGLIVSVVLFRLQGGDLQACLVPDSPHRLPCDAPHRDETLDAAARRIVRGLLHAPEEYMEQLYTFSPASEPQRNVVVSYLALIRPEKDPAGHPGIVWVGISDIRLTSGTGPAVLEYALVRLRAKLGYTNIAFHLVPDKFTLPELQRAYEGILAHPMDKRNFRRRILASGILVQTDEKRRDGSHRPAALYRFASQDDHTTYLTPTSPQETRT